MSGNTKSFFASGFSLMLAASCLFAADYPAWWTNRGVIANVSSTNDYVAVTAGQVKWIASNAFAEFEDYIPGGAGTAVEAVVAGFSSSNNYVGINAGQLKTLAKPFFDRLIEVDYTNTYPWSSTTTDDVSFAAVNIGQVKTVFGFNLGVDSDLDSLGDIWELAWFGSLSQTANGNWDNDADSNLTEYRAYTDPTVTNVSDTANQQSLVIFSPIQ